MKALKGKNKRGPVGAKTQKNLPLPSSLPSPPRRNNLCTKKPKKKIKGKKQNQLDGRVTEKLSSTPTPLYVKAHSKIHMGEIGPS